MEESGKHTERRLQPPANRSFRLFGDPNINPDAQPNYVIFAPLDNDKSGVDPRRLDARYHAIPAWDPPLPAFRVGDGHAEPAQSAAPAHEPSGPKPVIILSGLPMKADRRYLVRVLADYGCDESRMRVFFHPEKRFGVCRAALADAAAVARAVAELPHRTFIDRKVQVTKDELGDRLESMKTKWKLKIHPCDDPKRKAKEESSSAAAPPSAPNGAAPEPAAATVHLPPAPVIGKDELGMEAMDISPSDMHDDAPPPAVAQPAQGVAPPRGAEGDGDNRRTPAVLAFCRVTMSLQEVLDFFAAHEPVHAFVHRAPHKWCVLFRSDAQRDASIRALHNVRLSSMFDARVELEPATRIGTVVLTPAEEEAQKEEERRKEEEKRREDELRRDMESRRQRDTDLLAARMAAYAAVSAAAKNTPPPSVPSQPPVQSQPATASVSASQPSQATITAPATPAPAPSQHAPSAARQQDHHAPHDYGAKLPPPQPPHTLSAPPFANRGMPPHFPPPRQGPPPHMPPPHVPPPHVPPPHVPPPRHPPPSHPSPYFRPYGGMRPPPPPSRSNGHWGRSDYPRQYDSYRTPPSAPKYPSRYDPPSSQPHPHSRVPLPAWRDDEAVRDAVFRPPPAVSATAVAGRDSDRKEDHDRREEHSRKEHAKIEGRGSSGEDDDFVESDGERPTLLSTVHRPYVPPPPTDRHREPSDERSPEQKTESRTTIEKATAASSIARDEKKGLPASASAEPALNDAQGSESQASETDEEERRRAKEERRKAKAERRRLREEKRARKLKRKLEREQRRQREEEELENGDDGVGGDGSGPDSEADEPPAKRARVERKDSAVSDLDAELLAAFQPRAMRARDARRSVGPEEGAGEEVRERKRARQEEDDGAGAAKKKKRAPAKSDDFVVSDGGSDWEGSTPATAKVPSKPTKKGAKAKGAAVGSDGAGKRKNAAAAKKKAGASAVPGATADRSKKGKKSAVPAPKRPARDEDESAFIDVVGAEGEGVAAVPVPPPSFEPLARSMLADEDPFVTVSRSLASIASAADAPSTESVRESLGVLFRSVDDEDLAMLEEAAAELRVEHEETLRRWRLETRYGIDGNAAKAEGALGGNAVVLAGCPPALWRESARAEVAAELALAAASHGLSGELSCGRLLPYRKATEFERAQRRKDPSYVVPELFAGATGYLYDNIKQTGDDDAADVGGVVGTVVASGASQVAPSGAAGVEGVGGTSSSRSQRVNHRRFVNAVVNDSKASELMQLNLLSGRSKSLRFGRSLIHDWGLFTNEAIAMNDMVIEYVGEVVRSEVADNREKGYERQGIGSSYLFRLDDDFVVDSTRKGSIARFMNHSCEPNCKASIILADGSKRIAIYAKRDIAPGEEITYDYKFPIEDEKIPCFCGAPSCRGSLN